MTLDSSLRHQLPAFSKAAVDVSESLVDEVVGFMQNSGNQG